MSPSGLECIWSEGGLGERPQKDPSWLSSHLLPRWARAQYIVFLVIHLFLVSEYSILSWQGTPTTGEDWLREDRMTNPAKQKTSPSSAWWETIKEAGLQRSREAEVAESPGTQRSPRSSIDELCWRVKWWLKTSVSEPREVDCGSKQIFVD